MNDLVLRLTGGQRDGELIPVSTPRCYLGTEESEGSEQPACAIFRGPKGAAVKSYAGDVLVNGVAASVHWLKEGDCIEFPNSISIEVTQLGWVEQECAEHHDAEFEVESKSDCCDSPCENAESCQSESDHIVGFESAFNHAIENNESEFFESNSGVESTSTDSQFASCDPYYQSDQQVEFGPKLASDLQAESCEQASNEEVLDDTVSIEAVESEAVESEAVESDIEPNAEFSQDQKSDDDQRLDLIESQISELKSQKEQTEQRLNQLDEKLFSLTDQLDHLVSIAGGSAAKVYSEPDADEESFVGYQPESNNLESPVDADESETDVTSESLGQAELGSTEAETNELQSTDNYNSLGDYYSQDESDDDEKILTFDSSEEPSAEAAELATNVEIEDAPAELSGVTQAEIESRQSELEKVFGSAISGTESDEEVILSPSLGESNEDATLEQTADEQPADSFDTPTHGLDEDAVSSADETKEPLLTDLEPGSLASQLLSEVEKEECESTDVETVATVKEEEVEENEEAEQDEESGSSSFEAQSGVADLLARMKAEGKWDGVPEGEDDGPITPISEPVAEVHVAQTAETTPESEDDVQDYMSQLLTRMRGDSPDPSSASSQAPKTKNETKVEAKDEQPEPEFVAPANPLKPGEFKPKQKAKRIASLGAMRELANSTARQNVKKSEDKNRKELGYLQLGIAVCSFFMAVYYFLAESIAFMDTGFIVGIVCVGISGFLGYRFYSTMKYNELIEESPKSKPVAEEQAEVAVDADVVATEG